MPPSAHVAAEAPVFAVQPEVPVAGAGRSPALPVRARRLDSLRPAPGHAPHGRRGLTSARPNRAAAARRRRQLVQHLYR